MENFYRKVRKRSDEKPRLMTIIIALFYACMGIGFAGMKYVNILSVVVSCGLCAYMASLVYAIVKGNIVKAVLNCCLFFALGVLLTYSVIFNSLTKYDIALTIGGFGVFFIAGLVLGHYWYGSYIK